MPAIKFCRWLILLAGLGYSPGWLLAQHGETNGQNRPKSDLLLGIYGDASYACIQYEYLAHLNTNLFFAIGGGMGYNASQDKGVLNMITNANRHYLTLPYHGTLSWGGRGHYIEWGLGGTFLVDGQNNDHIFYQTISYRYQPLRRGHWLLRLFLQPHFGDINYDGLAAPVGISVGLSL